MESTSGNQPSTGSNIPSDMTEWVELFVREMMNASDIADARARASRAFEVFEKSVLQRAGVDAVEHLHKVFFSHKFVSGISDICCKCVVLLCI